MLFPYYNKPFDSCYSFDKEAFRNLYMEKGELDYYIGVATTKNCPDNLTELGVPASAGSAFEAIGPFPDTLQDEWGRIYSEWFPSSNYEQVGGPEIQWNENNIMDAYPMMQTSTK
jgi:predicted transcriptional regulator YdeE